MAKVLRLGGEVRIDTADVRQPPFGAIGALELALESMDVPIDRFELLGFSGYAFRLQVMQPDWEAVALQATVGHDLLNEISHSLGRAITPVPIERRFEYIRLELDFGRPLIVEREDAGLVVGYCEGRREALVVQPVTGEERWEKVDEWTWDRLYCVSPRAKPPEASVRIIRALEVAVRLMEGAYYRDRDSDFFWIDCGHRGYESWIRELRESDRFDSMGGNALAPVISVNSLMYRTLLDARTAASSFLQTCLGVLAPQSDAHLCKAVQLFARVSDVLEEGMDAIPQVPVQCWLATMRLRQSRALELALSLETQAETEIRSALVRIRGLGDN